MGLLSKILRKKEKKDTEKIVENKAADSTELTEEQLAEVCGYPNSDWCPKVDVPPIDIKGNQNDGRLAQNRSNLGR